MGGTHGQGGKGRCERDNVRGARGNGRCAPHINNRPTDSICSVEGATWDKGQGQKALLVRLHMGSAQRVMEKGSWMMGNMLAICKVQGAMDSGAAHGQGAKGQQGHGPWAMGKERCCS